MTYDPSRPDSSTPPTPRRVDHAVLPVRDLNEARARFEALGFSPAPAARHPFGTENHCVYLADGAYLELLGIAERESCESSALMGNAFTARDQAWRFRNGDEGFSAVAFSTLDADADHADFVRSGHSGGRMLAFSRPSRLPDGSTGSASFRLAFSADLRSPDCFMFTCQRTGLQQTGRETLEHHSNGAVALRRILAVESNPSDFQYLLQDMARQRHSRATSFGIELDMDGASLSVMTPEGLDRLYGVARPLSTRGLQLVGLELRCHDVKEVARLLDRNGIAFRSRSGQVIVDPARGQNFTLVFGAS